MQLGADPDLIDRELIDIIVRAIRQAPRSVQRAIGPSEMGSACLRKIGYRLSDVEPLNIGAAWLPLVGTGVHAMVADMFAAHNLASGFTRYLIEQRVTVGTVAGQPIEGTCDCYDRVTATVIDWKCVGLSTLRKVKRDGLPRNYRMQAHLYGRGYRNAGHHVERVAVMFLPRNAELRDRIFITEPYDESVALEALAIANAAASGLAELGNALLPLLPAAEDYCESCPWFNPFSRDVTQACPGPDGKTLLPEGSGDNDPSLAGII
jgi:hypothetical protein